MNYNSNPRVKACVQELAALLNPESDGVENSQLEKAIRLLRPAKGSNDHSAAIKTRIRLSILNNSAGSANGDGQLQLNKFENQCDAISKINHKLLNPFLTVFEPLSFRPERSISASHLAVRADKKVEERAFTGNGATSSDPPAAVQPPQAFPAASFFEPDNNQLKVLEADTVWVSKEVEHTLMVDLIYVFQGISGKHIKFDARSESYLLDPSLKLNSTVRDTVLCICELGWLYNRVAGYLKSSFAVATDSNGVVVQAFGFALQEELHDYYRLLAVLEQELQRTSSNTSSTPAGRSAVRPSNLLNYRADLGEGEGKEGNGRSEGPTGLTLLRMKAWLQEPIERMCQMARMVDGALPLRGGALVSRLYAHTQHGDPATKALVRRVLDSVCAPLYTVLSRWVLYGELQDPHKEFFVALNPSTAVRNIWRETYVLQHTMLPAYFSSSLAHKILLIGKSINFIRLCLQKLPRVTAKDEEIDAKRNGTAPSSGTSSTTRKSYRGVNKGKSLGMHGQIITAGEENSDFVPEDEDEKMAVEDNSLVQLLAGNGIVGAVAADATGGSSTAPKRTLNMADVLGGVVTPEVQAALQTLRFGGEATLQEIVFTLSARIDSKLLNLMMSRFYVQMHLLALKKFMLLGQGDFVTCLMDGVGPELKRRANQLFRHNLTGILEGALRASNAQFEPSYVLDRIGIRLLEASPGDSGWEIFSLDYSIDAPLNAIVHTDCISKYRIAFHMLWRLKRVEWSLATTWKQHTMFAHTHRAAALPPALRAVFHRCNLNRAMMMHVVNNLCAFLMFEVLETSWANLQETIGRARCVDDVITAHDAYLSEVLDRALLAPHHEGLNLQVQQLLHIVLRFCNLEETLIADAVASIARRKVALSATDERNRQGLKGSANARSEGDFDGVPDYVVSRIDEAVKEYSAQFDKLMFMLKEQGEKAGEILRFLTFRLDFNDFHAQQRAQGGHVGLTSTPPPHLKSLSHSRPAGDNDADRDRMVPARSDSPTFGPDAWTVSDMGGGGAGGLKKPKPVTGRVVR